MHVVVIGLGITGDTVVRHRRTAGDRVTVAEDAPAGDPAYAERAARAVAAGAELLETPSPEELVARVEHADLLVPSPGVPWRHPAVAAARAAGVPVRAEIDLAAETAGRRLVAVTGTNGKTTVTTLAVAMLEASGVRAVAAGNIGRPLLDAVATGAAVVVAEVSSFQLAFTTAAFRPRVAVMLNVAEDHLDWHGSSGDYVAAKARVFRHQTSDDVLVFNADDAVASLLAGDAPGRRLPFSITSPAPGVFRVADGVLVEAGGAPIVPVADLWATASHDRANALAAAAAALEVGATPVGVAAALRDFEALPHRMTLVAERAGVRYYDDSKATNPHATLRAVEGAADPVILVAGGRNKGLDLSVLRSLAPRLRGVVAIGEAAAEIEAVFAGAVPVIGAADMGTAVARAADQAKAGDAVILSPACASFDWYPSYSARGDDFAARVSQLPGAHRTPQIDPSRAEVGP
jgi:UDP-N-acetylmuramoylalanine--D-glutamate ligase